MKDKLSGYYDELDISEVCAVCLHASPVYTEGDCLCDLKGIVSQQFHCRKFFYDLTKRIPRRLPQCVMPPIDDEAK